MRVIVFVLLFFVVRVGLAQTHPLAAALEAAWARHPEAAALDARMEAAYARIDRSLRALPAAPELGVSALRGERGLNEWEVELAARLWRPGQRLAAMQQAEHALESVSRRRDALRWELAGRLRELWWTMAQAHASLTLARRELEAMRALEEEAARREIAGDLPRMQANLARAERLRAETEAEEAALRIAQLAMTWQALTGMPAPSEFPAESRREPSTPHPLLAEVESQRAMARAEQALIRSRPDEAPELSARLIREHEPGQGVDYRVGVRLKLPLALPPARRQAEAEARAAVQAAEAKQARLQGQIESELAALRAAMDSAAASLVRAETAAAFAQDSLQLAQKGFALGEVELATVLRLRSVAMETEAERIERELALRRMHSEHLQALGVWP